MAVREPLYQEVADLVVDTDNRRVRTVTREIVQALKERDTLQNG